MNLKWNYWWFKSCFSDSFCDRIINYAKTLKEEQALTGGMDADTQKYNEDDIRFVRKKRKSNITWISEDWLYRAIHPYIHEANRNAGWNFQWDWSEPCQFTKYGVGQYYGWHCDSWEKPYVRPQNADGTYPIDHGKIRKLSVTISLSEPDEYVGGNLEFDFRNQVDWERNKKAKIKECTEIRPRGSIIVFPSFVWHRVAPVTKGTRYSLVIWNLGYPFR